MSLGSLLLISPRPKGKAVSGAEAKAGLLLTTLKRVIFSVEKLILVTLCMYTFHT